MKKVLAISIFCLCVLSGYAQIGRSVAFSVSLPDTSYRHFFAKHPGISRMVIGFEEKKPISLQFNYTSHSQKDYHPEESHASAEEAYDLEFEGDVYRLSKKYNPVIMPVFPDAKVTYLPGITDRTDIKTYFDVKADIYPDSVVYNFSQNHYSANNEITLYDNKQRKSMYNPKFKGGFPLLAEILEQSYRKQKHIVVKDSVLLFKGVVFRDGSLNKIEMVSGAHDAFSELIEQSLQNSSKSWVPANRSGRPVIVQINIYVRLNSDGSFTASSGVENAQIPK